ncbi:DUF2845 domain-containing protein [Geothrix sp. SG200]|uniref:DUF2845 domain-containing protein n=1 Tax=Geothrix sp. SG200 TaxID=2922865 RepID=UPI001FAD3AB3|nr:DUF2845 domain-containing protein [Geothrix sp. SG200]
MRSKSPIMFFGAIALAMVGCFRDKPEVDLTRVSVGMRKDEVIQALGKPTRMAVQGSVEYLEYESYENSGWDWKGKRNFKSMFVRIMNGKVDSFGQKGDFDYTKNPTTDINVKQQIEAKVSSTTPSTPSTPTGGFDLKTELEKLEKMKKDGLVNDQEYQQLRQRLIDKAKIQ